MPAKATLSDLRNGIQDIYHEVMRDQNDGEALNTAVLARVRVEKAEQLSLLTPELVNMALVKLLNDVGGRKSQRRSVPEGIDLFGSYRVPRMVTIVRGKKKDTGKLSIREAEIYLKARSDKSATDRHEPLRRLIEACRTYVETDEDTLEILLARKHQAEQLAIQ